MTDDQPIAEDQSAHGQIRADRACIGCGFNLFGQPVAMEEHYGLAICRCPECGKVASLQSYPVMTHWVNRFRALLGAVWIVVLLAFFLGTSMAWMGMAQGTSNIAGQRLAEVMGEANYHWAQAKSEAEEAARLNKANSPATSPASATPAPQIPGLPAGTTIVTNNGVTTINGVVVSSTTRGSVAPNQFRWTYLNAEWKEQHLDGLIEAHGGLVKTLDTESLLMLIPGAIVSVLVGIFWSITLLGGSRKRALLVPLAAGLLAYVVLIATAVSSFGTLYAMSFAREMYAPMVGAVFIGWCFLCAAVGVFFGRKIGRFVVELALPARSRVPLSLLWTCDGKTMPKA